MKDLNFLIQIVSEAASAGKGLTLEPVDVQKLWSLIANVGGEVPVTDPKVSLLSTFTSEQVFKGTVFACQIEYSDRVIYGLYLLSMTPSGEFSLSPIRRDGARFSPFPVCSEVAEELTELANTFADECELASSTLAAPFLAVKIHEYAEADGLVADRATTFDDLELLKQEHDRLVGMVIAQEKPEQDEDPSSNVIRGNFGRRR